MGGVDAIVFTAGIGENSMETRVEACAGLEFLGVKISPEKNKVRGQKAIISNDNSIRICWHSAPIGKIGTSISGIIQNLKRLSKKVVEGRNCVECIENETCIKCKFPYPLSAKEYCEFKKEFNTVTSAKIINSFNIFKDILNDPVTIIDF